MPPEIVRARADRVVSRGRVFGGGAAVSVREPPTWRSGHRSRFARGPATDFSARRRARNRSWAGGCRISGFPSTSRRRGRRRADVVVVVVARRVAAVGRRERDARATRARRERDANRREPTTCPRRRDRTAVGATRARRARGGLRLIWNLVVRSPSTREFRRVEGANADDARARDVG